MAQEPSQSTSHSTTTATRQILPCFPYPGGKRRLLKHILPAIPTHRTYVEPFAGALAVLLAKKPAPVEVVNDINGELVAFFRVLKYHPEVLLNELQGYINAKANLIDLLNNRGWTDIHRAARFYLLQVCSFGAKGETWGRAKESFHGYCPLKAKLALMEVSQRMARVMVENRDAVDLIDFYDGPESFFFLDPPYVNCADTAYEAFTEFDMQRLRNRLDKIKGSWILTCDDSPTCRKVFAGLHFSPLSIKYTLSNGRDGKRSKESGEMLVFSPRLKHQCKLAA
jgi:DNA adenine methylase